MTNMMTNKIIMYSDIFTREADDTCEHFPMSTALFIGSAVSNNKVFTFFWTTNNARGVSVLPVMIRER